MEIILIIQEIGFGLSSLNFKERHPSREPGAVPLRCPPASPSISLSYGINYFLKKIEGWGETGC